MAKVDTLVGVRALPEIPDGTKFNTAWETMTMADSAGSAMSFSGANIWSHNGEIYLNSTHKWDKASQTWVSVEWFFSDSETAATFQTSATYIFTWNGAVYLRSTYQKVYCLPAGYTGNTWQVVTFSGYMDAYGSIAFPELSGLWTDKDNRLFYTKYSAGTSFNPSYFHSYIARKGSSDLEITFSPYTWYEGEYSSPSAAVTAVTELYGSHLWADSKGNIYDAKGKRKMVYGVMTTPEGAIIYDYYLAPADDFAGFTSSKGKAYMWSDSINVYYCANTSTSYIFDEASQTWVTHVFDGISGNVDGSKIWTDGTNLYYSNSSTHYKLAALPKDINPCYLKENGEWVKKDVFQLQNGEWVQISFKD